MLKITIRQAPILSAMRIKFVGSVNNKKQACSLLQILNIKKSVPADWQMRKGEKLRQTVIGKPSDRDIKTCLHKPQPLPRCDLHTQALYIALSAAWPCLPLSPICADCLICKCKIQTETVSSVRIFTRFFAIFDRSERKYNFRIV